MWLLHSEPSSNLTLMTRRAQSDRRTGRPESRKVNRASNLKCTSFSKLQSPELCTQVEKELWPLPHPHTSKHPHTCQSLQFPQGTYLYMFISVQSFGEGNGTPLQYSCLENPMDGWAWSQFGTPAVPCLVLTVAFWPAYRFLRRQERWSSIPISWGIFHSFLWSTSSKALA